MPEAIALAFDTPGLGALFVVISIAGIVRGFAGFGTALIFVPVAGIYLAPGDVILLLTVTGLASIASLLPRALSDGDVREVGILTGGALLTLPIGLWLLSQLDALVIRWCVAALAGGMLCALLTGWRYSGAITGIKLPLIGSASGLFGGMTGLTGPVVILFYLAGERPVKTVRANTILFLASLDVFMAAGILYAGLSDLHLIWLGLALSVPYFLTTLIGQRLFDPTREALYRKAAYLIIAVAVLRGLPIWG